MRSPTSWWPRCAGGIHISSTSANGSNGRPLKARERPDGRGVLDGLPATLPELLMAFRLQERAAGVGFDWPDTTGPLAKVREELAEVEDELAGGW